MTTEKRTEEQTLTMTATEQPGSEWELAEKNVKKERVEVEYILPNGQTATGWKMVYYHRYKRTLTFSTTYKIWQYAERTVLHKWRREIHSTAVRYSLTKPVGDDHIVGEIETKTFSCSDEHAPKYEEACLPEYDPSGEQPSGPGL